MWGRNLSLLLLIFLFVPMSLAVTINPTEYEIKDPKFNKDYNIIITVINPDINSYDVTTHIPRESAYLKDYVKIDPAMIHLSPNGKKNVKLTLSIPPNISPERHELFIDFRTLSHSIGMFRLSFKVDGEQKYGLELKDVQVDAKDTETPLYFVLNTENQGNVIADATPNIKLYKGEELVDTLGEESRMNIMPSEKMNLSLMYDPAALDEGGLYSFKAFLKYKNHSTKPVEKTFYLNEVQKDSGGKSIKTVSHGEKLALELSIHNTGDALAFYQIEGRVQGTNITKTIEGSLDQASKDVVLNLDTTKLDKGKYNLDVKISKGKDLEDVEKREFILKVKSSFDYTMLAVIFLAFLAGIAVIFFRSSLSLSSLVPDFSGPKIKKVDTDIRKLSKSFNNMESNINSLGVDINNFITNANDWLDRNSNSSVRFR